jgi:hypothetical protein
VDGKGIGRKYMSRKLQALSLLIILLLAGGYAWSMGQRMDIFVPVDALIADKKYSEAIDMLRNLLVSVPSRTSAIKDKIGSTQLLMADDLIRSQHYNEAIADLRLYWVENPEKADLAQRRIQKINLLREEYNKKAKELLAYMRDPQNRVAAGYNEEVAKRLDELDKLDRNNPDSKKTIIGLKETSTALVNQDRMKAAMSAGRSLLDSGEYVKAARAYLKEFDLFKAEFENAGYDDLTVQAVQASARRVLAAPDSYEAAQAALTKAVADLGSAFDSGLPDRVEAALPPARQALEDLRLLRESLFSTGESLARSYNAIPKEGKSPIEYQYLAYLDIFTRGRPDSFLSDKKPDSEKGKAEGVGGVLLSQTEAILDKLGKSAQASLDSAYAAAEGAYDGAAFGEASASFARASALVAPVSEVLDSWALVPETDFVPDLATIKAKIAAAAANKARVAQLGTLAAAGQRLSGLAADYGLAATAASSYIAHLDAATSLAEARTAIDGYRASIKTAEASLAAEGAAKPGLAAQAAAAASGLGDDRPNAVLASYVARLDKAIAAARSAETALAAARGGVEGDYIARELAARSAALDAAEARTAGSLSDRPDRAKAGYKDPSPSGAAIDLAAEEPKLNSLVSWIAGDLASMDTEGAAIVSDPAFASARARVGDLGQRAAVLMVRRAADLAAALDQKKSALTMLAAAKADMAAAQARLADAKNLVVQDKGKGTKSAAIQKDISDSRARLENSLAGVVNSSNLDFDPKTWDDFQALYAQVSADLALAKKNFVVNETFRLLGEGQTYYEQALFDLASESLNSAQELWRQDNDADQEQVKFWQNLVRQASDTNNKREVKQSDSLYFEIGGYLSEARRLFQQGDSLVKAGKPSDAASAFDAARQNISYVTRAFPLNAEAGLLTLQILKSTDADAYKKSLPRRIQEAVNLLATDSSSGYSRLADLYKMEPTYPGLQAALQKAEILVGKRRAPPTKQQLAAAASFVASAQKLLASGRADDRSKAETALNNALNNDPTDRTAHSLLRDIKTLQGSGGLTLKLADQAILDQATRSFASRQYNQARAQLSDLLADPAKRTREVLKLDADLKTLGY